MTEKNTATKQCSICRQVLDLETHFLLGRDRRGDGRHPYCHECRHKRHREYWKATKKQRNRQKKANRLGLTVAELDAAVAGLGTACMICGEHAAAVDHCHTTNVIRGVLCSGCNLGLGHFKDSPVRLRAAAEYLLRSP